MAPNFAHWSENREITPKIAENRMSRQVIAVLSCFWGITTANMVTEHVFWQMSGEKCFNFELNPSKKGVNMPQIRKFGHSRHFTNAQFYSNKPPSDPLFKAQITKYILLNIWLHKRTRKQYCFEFIPLSQCVNLS